MKKSLFAVLWKGIFFELLQRFLLFRCLAFKYNLFAMKKVLFVFSLLLLLFFWGCDRFEYDCGPYYPHFQIYDLSLTPTERYTDEQGIRRTRAVQAQGTVRYDSLNLMMLFEVAYLRASRQAQNGMLYALTCPSWGDRGSKVGVDTLYLIAKKDYNAQYRAGDTLNPICRVRNYRLQEGSIGEYVAANDSIVLSPYALSFSLSAPPSRESMQAFELVYQLDNGDVFGSETDAFTVQP